MYGALHCSATILQDTAVNADVSSRAAGSLVQLGSASDVVINGLLDLLKDDSFSLKSLGKVSDRAAQSLVALSKHSDAIKPALVQWIEQHQQEDYVGNGIDALWELVN